MIEIAVQALIGFYSLEVKPFKDVKRDLLVNLVTGLVLSDEVYFLLFNLFSVHYSRELHKLNRIMTDREVLERQLGFDALKVKPQFAFD